ncbi:MAG: HNH endonuclease [Gammaproteobacteria bacterium]|nr:HNH endonuclease [Gammaproteobacteria bacterium]MYC89278.1 HNH endonuclease [Candidatus Palauibacter denitrificans]MYJ75503.1 HNH endonuclease [Gammaproteobacteria bacterium]
MSGLASILSPLAVKLVDRRLKTQLGLFGQIIERTDVPARTDLGDEVVPADYKAVLYGEQQGNCNGCRYHFQYRNLAVDHIHPRTKGGTNHAHNLQLLCTSCNSMKGVGTQEALVAKLKQQGLLN